MNNDLNHTTVDIILPNYNSELYVSETINSVINQTFKNWKLIIVDSNSNKETQKILKNYADHKNINIKAKMICSVNTFIVFFDDPGFQQPSFDSQPDNYQNKQVFVNGNRNFYVKVESDM